MENNNKAKFFKNSKEAIEGIISLIKQSRRIVILTHYNPDGDAVGSAYAMYDFCRQNGADVISVINGEFPSNLKFINPNNEIESYDASLHNDFIVNSDLIIFIDLNDPARVGDIQEPVSQSNAVKLLIDHHLEPEDFCDFNFVDYDASSAGQMVYEIIVNYSDYEWSKSTAMALYTAIMTDTGSFRFPKTNSNVHRITADLIDRGANPSESYDRVYNQFPISATKLKGKMYSNIQLLNNGSFCLSKISRVEFEEANAKEEEIEGFVETLLAIKGVNSAALVIESPEQPVIRCSFRSKNGIEIRSVAVNFGGGGHSQAAGARIRGKSLDEAIKDIEEYINKNY